MINVAVIGCGYWGPNLIRNFYEINEANMYACCDLKQERLDLMKKRFPGIKTTTNYTKILKNQKIEAIAIATPPATHYTLAKKALEAHKHVLIEKPMTLTSRNAQKLITLAQQKRKVLMVGHTFEYVPAVNKLKKLIQTGKLGKIHYIHTQRLNLGLWQPDCNVIWDLAPHDISIILYLLEQMPASVSAKAKWHIDQNKEDIAFITLHFPKTVAHLHISWLDPLKIRKTVVVGSKKMAVYDDIEPTEKLKVYNKNVTKHNNYTTYGEFQMSYNYGDAHIPKLNPEEPLKTECKHFLHCIKHQKKPRSNGKTGLKVVKILEAIEKSTKKGGKETKIK